MNERMPDTQSFLARLGLPTGDAFHLPNVAAPMYVRLGLLNSPGIYPTGLHLENAAIAMARERVHRAALVLDLIRRYVPEPSCRSPALGIWGYRNQCEYRICH